MTLTSLLEYHPGQIVNRVLMHNESGLVVMMAFDKDTHLDTHSAAADVMVQILEGTCEFTLLDTPHILRAGDAITMHPGDLHSLRAPERFKMLLTKLNA